MKVKNLLKKIDADVLVTLEKMDYEDNGLILCECKAKDVRKLFKNLSVYQVFAEGDNHLWIDCI